MMIQFEVISHLVYVKNTFIIFIRLIFYFFVRRIHISLNNMKSQTYYFILNKQKHLFNHALFYYNAKKYVSCVYSEDESQKDHHAKNYKNFTIEISFINNSIIKKNCRLLRQSFFRSNVSIYIILIFRVNYLVSFIYDGFNQFSPVR